MQEGGKVGEAREKILICTTGVVALDSPQCLLLPNIQFFKQTKNKQPTPIVVDPKHWALDSYSKDQAPPNTNINYKIQESH